MPVGLVQEGGEVSFLARIERARDDPSALRLDVGDQRRQLHTLPPSSDHDKSFGSELPGDRGADVVAGADHRY